ncbi:MAG: hypothetical protein Q9163_004697, partial [Psora crenata]
MAGLAASLPGGSGAAILPPSSSGHHESHTPSHSDSSTDVSEKEDSDNTRAPELEKTETWGFKSDLQAHQQHLDNDEAQKRKLGVTWKGLTVKGVAADAALSENVMSNFNIPRMIKESRRKPQLKTILEDTHGCVKPGEMLLVLGKPGAGCTTLLNLLSNQRLGYEEVTGDVSFGSLTADQAKSYRGQIVMNSEEELFFPTLTVRHTMDFATRLKVPYRLPSTIKNPSEYATSYRDFLLEALSIPHTADTKVGNEYVRGVSGGERKRVSILETLATRSSIFCWDNSTRGLDASTALQYTKVIRAMTDAVGLASVVTLYQAGNGIYELFDKVLVLDAGKEMYYGPMEEARPFMESLGFFCDPSANVADFLTGVTVPTERQIRDGFESRFPRTAAEIRAEYLRSPIKVEMEKEYNFPNTLESQQNTEQFKAAVASEQHKLLPKGSPLTVGFPTQVGACIVRQYHILKGDKATLIIKQAATLVQSLIVGSLFYMASDDSQGLFYKSGALFFSLLYQALMALSEVTDNFAGRPVLQKHKQFALFHPAAFCVAQIILDIPIILFQITHFAVVIYFMVGLKADAAAFFTYWIFLFSVGMSMTTLFRMIGAVNSTFDNASKISGFWLNAIITFIGYFQSYSQMHPWLYWIFWINPLSYGFEAIMANEFHGQTLDCINQNLIPNGPTYADRTYQSCAGVRGAKQGLTSVTGDQYLTNLSYSHTHVWRNFGIVWAWWALYLGVTIIATSNWKPAAAKGRSLLIPRENAQKNVKVLQHDAESQMQEKAELSATPSPEMSEDVEKKLIRNTSVFTWKNLTYTVKTPSGDRVLLDNVQGWIKPGMLGALMGASGAGKTTLLDVLAQRKTEGTIQGSVLVDGRPLSVSFQRSAGYCEQLDVHEPLATVREALEFSALLRQSRDIPRAEKLAYVDTILNLLEMQDIEHTLVGKPGAGLSVEQRKRLTIGVELVSKPSILIFLDEPTSGLDGQAAFNTLRFLRKLAAAGQAILVTIHQPSAKLFKEFDTLLLLAKGGKTVYFGDIGDDARVLSNYFRRNGAPCPPDLNPAEHMIDVVSGSSSQGKDWNQIWLQSPEYQATMTELNRITEDAAAKEPGTKDDGYEFAIPLWQQIKLVTGRMNVSLFRNVEYVTSKFGLHIGAGLFNGFAFWKIGDTVSDLQLKLFTIFIFIFVAPGVINQLQPLFIDRRNIYEAREKKSKMYSWVAFVTGLIVSEFPYLCVCAVLYFATWYYTCGFPTDSNKAGATFFVMLFYEFIYTGIGQATAAYAPNAVFASLVNPVIITILVSFCGVLVPYQGIQEFWRYWMYYVNPFNYLMGSILVFTTYGAEVQCAESEYAIFDTPGGSNQTCADYLSTYMQGYGARTKLVNPDAISGCKVCQYRRGSDYLATLNLREYFYGWRDAAICVIFAISSYMLVIYQLEKSVHQTSTPAPDAEASPLLNTDDPDAIFRRALDQELERVCSFYQLKELEIYGEVGDLLKDEEAFDSDTAGMDIEQLDGGLDQGRLRRGSLFGKLSIGGRRRRTSTMSASTIEELEEESDDDPNERTAMHGSGMLKDRQNTYDASGAQSMDGLQKSIELSLPKRRASQVYDDYSDPAFKSTLASGVTLKKRTISLYVSLCELKSFIQLNRTGFSKVCKKYDKILNRDLKNAYLHDSVNPAYPFRQATTQHLDENTRNIEKAYANIITKGDLPSARRELRLHLREHVVWERNTVWREMIGIERKAQAAKMGITRTLLGGDNDPAKARLQGDDDPDGMAMKELVTPVGRYRCPRWLLSSTFCSLLVICAIFVVLLLVPIMKKPEQQNCLAMLVFVSLLWATEVIPLFVTALMIPFLTVVLQVVRADQKPHHRLDPPTAAKYVFASMWTPVIMLLLGGFTIAAALSKFHIAKILATVVLSKAGTRPRTVLITNMFVAMILSMWISNVASPVLCYSIIQPLLRNLPSDSSFSKALILGIALASNIGGAASPIASPQNIIALQNMRPQPSWGIWFFVALPVCIVSILLIWLLLLMTFQPGKGTTIVPIRPMKDKFTGVQWFISGVTIVTIALWCVTHQLEHTFGDMGVVAIIPIVLFFGTGILTKEDFNNFLWTIIVLAAGGLSLGKAVSSSGLLHTVAGNMTEKMEGMSLYTVMVVFAALILVIATFISHTVAALVILPLVHQVGAGMAQPHPNLLVLSSAMMCSAAMGLPTSGFPNI